MRRAGMKAGKPFTLQCGPTLKDALHFRSMLVRTAVSACGGRGPSDAVTRRK